jgi:probable rRNA maturation factor
MKPTLLNNDTQYKIPSIDQFDTWIQTVIDHHGSFFQVSIEIVDELASQELNNTYRNKNKSTNVLSFALDLPEEVEEDLIGDLVICAPVVEQEAIEQNKSLIQHWAHLTIHGTLHLLGFDHVKDDDAELMEALEVELLQKLGIANPYE